jgi:hypothetical protein
MGLIDVGSSPLAMDSCPASAWVGRETVRCVVRFVPSLLCSFFLTSFRFLPFWFQTTQAMNNHFLVDFRNKYVKPTHYTLRHYVSWFVFIYVSDSLPSVYLIPCALVGVLNVFAIGTFRSYSSSSIHPFLSFFVLFVCFSLTPGFC